jgi:copper(I)-binding protein
MTRISRLLLAPLALLVLASCGSEDTATDVGAETEIGGVARVTVEDAWARTSSMNAENGAVYMLLASTTDDAVVSASVEINVAMAAEVHETTIAEDGSMSMQMVMSVALPAGQTVTFEPGGYHIMLMGLVEPLAAGDIITVTLTLESGSTIAVDAEVRDDAE